MLHRYQAAFWIKMLHLTVSSCLQDYDATPVLSLLDYDATTVSSLLDYDALPNCFKQPTLL